MIIFMKAALGLLASLFGFLFFSDAFRKRASFSATPWPGLLSTGFGTSLLDALGIGNFASQTALFKIFKMLDDRVMPGTLNVGNALPTVAEAFIFMTVISVQPLTLGTLVVSASVGGVLGAGVVSRMSRRRVRLGMGTGLLVVALIILAGLLGWVPVGGEATSLAGWKLALAAAAIFVFGALQTIGIGFYAPCMAMVYSLGMNPKTAFPIMMTAGAMLQAACSMRFVKEDAYDPKACVALSVAGVVGVLVAAYIVKSLALTAMKWIVLGVVLYTSVLMFLTAARKTEDP
jgi:uncharacterized membrane protein YfcA